jgi:hypothetical protein
MEGRTMTPIRESRELDWAGEHMKAAPEAPRETYTTSNQHDNDAWANAAYAGFASPEEHDAATLTAAPEAPQTQLTNAEKIEAYPKLREEIRYWLCHASDLRATAAKLAEALRMACRVIEGENLDEAMAGEYEILTDALAQFEKGAH